MNSTAFFQPTQSSPLQPLELSKRSATKQRALPQNSLFGAPKASKKESESHPPQAVRQQSVLSASESEDNIRLPSRRRRIKQSKTALTSSSESDDSLLEATPIAKSSHKQPSINESSRTQIGVSRKDGRLRSSSEPVNTSTRKTRSQTRAKRVQHSPSPSTRSRRSRQAPPSVGSDVETEDPEQAFSPPRERAKMQGKQVARSIVSNDDSDDIVSSISKRRPLREAELSEEEVSPRSRKWENTDLVEDLEFLQSADVSATLRNQVDKKKERMRNLEIMKARRERRGTRDKIVTIEDSDSDTHKSQEQDNPDVTEDSEDAQHEASLDNVRRALLDDGDEYDKEFVDDEGAETLGAPDLAEIPLELTMHAHQGVKHHFRKRCRVDGTEEAQSCLSTRRPSLQDGIQESR